MSEDNEVRCIWLTRDETNLSDAQLYNIIKLRYDVGISPETMYNDYRFGDCKQIVSGVLATLGAPLSFLQKKGKKSRA